MSIDVEETHFQQDDIERYGVGAGIVPVSRAPDGELYILLGRERFMPSWKGSCRWSGFEGSRKTGESMLHTAVREYIEESIGVIHRERLDTERFKKSPEGGRAASRAGSEIPEGDIEDLLSDGKYWIRVVIKILNERRAERYHATYVVPVTWDESIPARFLQKRLAIEQIDYATQEWHYSRPSTLLGFVGAVSSGEPSGISDPARKALPPSSSESQEIRVSVAQGASRAGSETPDATEELTFTGESARNILHWEHMRRRIERMLGQLGWNSTDPDRNCHPSVQVVCDPTWGRLQDVRVCRDYLEKDQVRWWSVSQLGSILESRGFHGSERFRPYFLPVLQVILRELKLHPPC